MLESVRAFAEASAVNCLLLLPSAVLAVFVILWVFSRVLVPFVRLLLDRTPSLDVQLDAGNTLCRLHAAVWEPRLLALEDSARGLHRGHLLHTLLCRIRSSSLLLIAGPRTSPAQCTRAPD